MFCAAVVAGILGNGAIGWPWDRPAVAGLNWPRPVAAGRWDRAVAAAVRADGTRRVVLAAELARGAGAAVAAGPCGVPGVPAVFVAAPDQLCDAGVTSWAKAAGPARAAHLEVLRELADLAGSERAKGFAAYCRAADDQSKEPAAALAGFARAAGLFEAAGEPAWVAYAWHRTGVIHADAGRYKDALTFYRRALAIRERLYAGPHPDVAQSLHNTGWALAETGGRDAAVAHYEKALAMRRALYRRPHREVGRTLLNLGELHMLAGRPDRAMVYLQESLDVRRRLAPVPYEDIAVCHVCIGATRAVRGDMPGAARESQLAIECYERAGATGRKNYSAALTFLAAYHTGRGEYDLSTRLYEKSVAVLERLPGDQTFGLTINENNLAAQYSVMGDHGRALRYYERALARARAAPDPSRRLVVIALNNLATAHFDLGQFDRAAAALREGLAVLGGGLADDIELAMTAGGRKTPAAAVLRMNLANIALQRGDTAAAVRDLKAVEADLVRSEARPSANLIAVWQTLGFAHAELDDPAAVGYYRRSLAEARAKYSGFHPTVYRTAVSLAAYLGRAGDPAAAARTLDDELGLAAAAGRPPTLYLSEALFSRGAQYESDRLGPNERDRLREADRCYAAACDALERFRAAGVDDPASRVQAVAHGYEVYPARAAVLARLAELESDPGRLTEALATAERGRAAEFAFAVRRSRADVSAGLPADLVKREADLRAAVRAAGSRVDAAQARPRATAAELAPLWAARRAADDALRACVADLSARFPRYAALRDHRPCSAADARACLAADEAAVVFLAGQARTAVVVLDGATGRVRVAVTAGREAFAARIDALTDPETLTRAEATRDAGAALYAALLAPVADAVRGKNLVVVPDGPLCLLPFELLVEGGRFLVETRRVRYAPSLTALHLVRQWDRARPRPDVPLFAVGDPVFGPPDDRLGGPAAGRDLGVEALVVREGGTRGDDFRRLVHSGAEVRAIRDALGADASAVRTGFAATPDAVRAASADGRLARARFVHFATHGVLGAGDGQPPALVLGRLESGPADQLLRADEVPGLRLNADLVVLSACRTGRGRLHAGEGVSSMARAFLAAGSRGVVCSLWGVDDRQTARLMAAMYDGLLAGRPAADALRAAKLRLLADGAPPFFWAAFVLQGE